MTRTHVSALAFVALLAACGGSDGPTEPTPVVTSVTVTPSASTLDQGSTVQLQVSVQDQSGEVMAGQTVTWATSNGAVATISSSGLVTAVSPGAASMTATVAGVAGSSAITVSGSQCSSATTVSLSAGQSQAFAASDCLVLPSGAAGDRYRVTVLRTDEAGSESDVATATLKVVGLGVNQFVAPPAPASASAGMDAGIPGLSPSQVRRAIRVTEATRRFHEDMRDKERRLMESVGLEKLVLGSTRQGLGRVAAQADSPEKITLDTTTGSSCDTNASAKKTAVRIYETDDLVFYQDSTQNAGNPLSPALAQQMAEYYTTHAKQMILDYFGEPSDIDENGKVVVVATPIVTGDVAAFVWSGDFLTTSSCAASNEGEFVYFSLDLIQGMEDGDSYQALETLAHEMKHVVSIYNRVAATRRAGSARYHPSWIEEGTAEIAGEKSARIAWASIGGPPVNGQVTRQSFVDTPAPHIVPENYGVAIKMARTAWYLSGQPNGLVVTPTGAPEGASVYGSGWLFHRWLGDAYGSAASAPHQDASLFKALNDSLAGQGIAGLAQQTGKPFLQLLDEFAVAVALHKAGSVSVARDFTTYDIVSAAEIFCTPNPLGVFPWPVTTTGTAGSCDNNVSESSNPSASYASANYSGPIGPAGMRIHDFLSNGTGTGAQVSLEVTGAAKIIVTRVR